MIVSRTFKDRDDRRLSLSTAHRSRAKEKLEKLLRREAAEYMRANTLADSEQHLAAERRISRFIREID